MKHSIFEKAAAFLATMLLCVSAFAQNKPLSGKVVDQNGEPIIGASVVVVGNTTLGAVTDIDGNYSFSVPANANVTASCIGYASQTVAVAGQSVINFTLAEDNEFLEETVVIGYGVQKKSDLTGSVASVRSDDLQDRSTSDAAAALQGKAAGVQIFNASGAPGSGSSIRVRGISSNSGSGLGPLLIVDGLKVDNIQYLDPSMIESMEVLKDAASAAIYGAQAGNGVVLITTKSGQKATDGTIFYNYKLSLASLGHYAEVMDARQYIDWQRQASASFPQTDEALIASGWWDGVTDTKWADVLYGTGVTHNHTFGAQGANDRGSYYLSINSVDEDGMARGDKDYYKRLTAQINADYKIKKWFTVGTNTSIEYSKKQMIGEHSEYAGSSAGLLGTLIIDPLTPVYFKSYDELSGGMQDAIAKGIKVYGPADHPDWYYSTSKILEGDGINPLIYRDRNENKSEGWNIRGTVYANLTPFKGFVFTSRMGYRINQSYSSNYQEPFYVNSKAYSNEYSISATSSQGYYYQWENFANYNTTLGGKHDIGVMAGMSYTFNDSRSVGASLTGSDPLKGYAENFRYLTQDNGSGTKGISGGAPSNSSQISYFGRLNYSYDSRYSLQVNFRADAFDSSKLSPKNRWGYFPSVSAGWTVSNEPWFKDNVDRNILNFLKIRGSWGINGNIAVLSGYPYSTSISYNSQSYQYDGNSNELSLGSIPDGLANPNLTWETSHQTDLGLDLRMFNNRLTFGFDWYNKDTEDLLVNISPVAEVGISSTTVNAGAVNNTGLEFELGWQDTIGDFHYSLNGNLSTLKNKVTYLEPSVGHITGSGFANYKLETYFQEGYPVWYLRGFEYAGIGENGRALFYDANGEITADPVDADLKYIGNALPKLNFGLTLRLDWKGLDFTMFGSGAAGFDLVPCVYRTQHFQINSLVWYYENSGKTIPSISNMWDDVEFWSSDATLFKGDYFKIKQMQLGYTLPKKWVNTVMIDNLRAYVSMEDWFTFTKYPGFDPETASTGGTSGNGLDKGSYPNAKRLLLGVNITF
ncbi:MAG: TonB-dependent receptor [Bacteroidia bacterium]|nr:TonB-dependent receptor [Bacteroidia bacterium]